MKKRILSLLLIAVMAFTVLAGCGSKDVETPEAPNTEVQDPAFGADLAEFYNKIMNAAEEGPFMMDVAAEAEMLEMTYPGLKDIETKQLVAFTPAMSAVAIEFAFVEVANAADVEAVKTIFQTRIDNQVNGGAWYPETIEGWKNNSEIVVIDNYVCLFVCAEKDGMIDALRNGTEVPAWAKAQAPVEGEGNNGIMDMPVEDGPAAFDPGMEAPAFDPEAETSTAPVAPPADLDHDVEVEDSTPAVEPSAPAASKVDTYVNAITNCGSEMVQYNTTLYSNMPEDADGAMMAPMALEMLGLTVEDVENYAVNMSFMNVKAYNISLIQPKEGKTQAVVDALNTYVSNTQMNFEMYLADQYEVALAAKVDVLSDGTVALVMCEGQDAVFQSIKTAVEG